jgi:hypothetical protein
MGHDDAHAGMYLLHQLHGAQIVAGARRNHW